MKQNIGAAMTGSSGKGRVEHDFYPTPAPTTRALLSVLREQEFPAAIWEPMCGEGDLAEVLIEDGYSVTSTDLIDRGYGTTLDFMASNEALAPAIVTNPPFNIAHKIILHALSVLGVEYMALLLSNNFWNAATRASLFADFTPSLVLPLTWRIDSTGANRPTMNLQWNVWRPNTRFCRFVPLVTNESHPGRLPIVDPLS